MTKMDAFITAKKIVGQKYGRAALDKLTGDQYDRLVLGFMSRLLNGKCDSAGNDI